MMFGDLLRSPFDILVVPVGMILLFVVILMRMYVPRKPVISKDADRQGLTATASGSGGSKQAVA